MTRAHRNASSVWIGLFCTGFAIASCGGRIDSSSSAGSEPANGDDTSSSDRDASSTGFEAGLIDGGTFDDEGGSPPYPPVDNGPNDTDPVCSSREALDCSCTGEDCPDPPDWYFGEIVRGCLASGGYVCDWVYADFDSDGCAVDLRAMDADDVFVQCVTKELNSERWLCMKGASDGQLRAYVDCTTK